MSKKKQKKPARVALLLLVLAGLASAAFGYDYYSTYLRRNSIADARPINIYRATDYQGLLDSIAASGAVVNMKTFAKVAHREKLSETFKPGHYELKGGLTNKEIERVFSHGWQTPVRLLIKPGIRDIGKLCAVLGRQMEADSAEFAAALADRQVMGGHGFRPSTYLAMFIPDTYEVYWTSTPFQLLERMKKEYDAFWTDARRAKAESIGLSRDEVVTLASIVIEETKYEPEMPTVAGVYMNRLHKGMLLQADPTVKYAVNDPSLRRILNVHLQVDSPYNTYKHPGLPPGPITIPTKKAIDAVLGYQHHNYLYFCAHENMNGQHRFAETYAKHLENARRFHSALTARERTRLSAAK